MAVVIWREGKSELCDPMALQYQLKAGWCLSKAESLGIDITEELTDEQKKEIEEENLSDEEKEIKALREKGKELKIRGWNNMLKENLIEKIAEAEQNAVRG
jgi:hypothetical protein